VLFASNFDGAKTAKGHDSAFYRLPVLRHPMMAARVRRFEPISVPARRDLLPANWIVFG
jgi:hypothetical protein